MTIEFEAGSGLEDLSLEVDLPVEMEVEPPPVITMIHGPAPMMRAMELGFVRRDQERGVCIYCVRRIGGLLTVGLSRN